MQQCPLYDSLLEYSRTTSDMSPKTLCTTLSSLSKEDSELVYSLMYHHSIINHLPIDDNLFKSRNISSSGGLLMNLNNIPLDLQKILVSFVKMKATI